MAVLRRSNLPGQMRVDSPTLRLVESSVIGDFDLLSGQILSGLQPLIVKGFEIVNSGTAIGQNVNSLQMNVTGSMMMNYFASEAGSLFYVPPNIGLQNLNDTNIRFQGSFTANSVNYVGIDLFRNDSATYAFSNTTDTVKFLDVSTDEPEEITRQIPLALLLDFKIIVSTQDFDSFPSVAPVAKITTDSVNSITAIEDCRYTPFRLARGGSFPSISRAFEWPQGRQENTTGDVFYGGDKGLTSYKDWSDAMMSRVWELGGGRYWYSPTADRNVAMTRSGTAFSNGEWFEWTGTNLHWRGLRFVFDNSGGSIWYNTISDQTGNQSGGYGVLATDLADGDCIYVDIDRTTNTTLTAVKGQVSNLGAPTTPGSRYIVAWRVGSVIFTRGSSFPVGATFTVATTSALGIVKLSHTAVTPLAPIVYSDGAANVASGVVALNADKQAAYTATSSSQPALAVTGFAAGVGIRGTGGATSGIGIDAVGGATAGAAIKATTAAAGSALVIAQSTSGTNTANLIQMSDSDTNIRNLFDHFGYMTGRYNRVYENWHVYAGLSGSDVAIPIAKYPSWSAIKVGSGALAMIDPSSAYPSSMISATITSAADDSVVLYSANKWVHTGFTEMLFSMEWEAATTVNSNSQAVFMGLSSSTANLDNVIGFRVAVTGGTNFWNCVTSSAGTPTTTSGVTTFTNDQILSFRMELLGSASPLGALTARFYINGTLRATHTTNIASAAMSCMFLVTDPSIGAANHLSIGPVVANWNRFASVG